MFVYFASLIRSWSNRELFRNWFPETEIQANIVCMWPLNAKGALVCERQEARELAGFPNTSRNQKSQRRCNIGFIGCWGICLNTVLFAINKSVFPFLSCKCDPIMPSEFSLLLKGKKKRSRRNLCCQCYFWVHYHFVGYCAVFREQCGCVKLDVFTAIFMTAFGRKTETFWTEENLLIICCQCSWDKPLWILKLLNVFHRTIYIYHECSFLLLSADQWQVQSMRQDQFFPALFHFPYLLYLGWACK